MQINRVIRNKSNLPVNKGTITDLSYEVCTDIEKKEDSFKSTSHITGHTGESVIKEFDMKEYGNIALKGETKFKGKVKSDMEISHDRFLLNPAIKLKQQNIAGLEIGKDIKISDIQIHGTIEAGVQANADTGIEGVFHVSSKECEFGFKLADRIEFGTYEGVKLSAFTQRGSNVNVSVRLEQGPQLGGAVGAGIKIDREAIHGRLELDGNFGLFGTDLRASFTMRYDDIKHAMENIAHTVIAGPLGMAVSRVLHGTEGEDKLQERSRKEDKKAQVLKKSEKDSEVKKPESEDLSPKNVSHQHFRWQILKIDD
ncbi:MAG: hypothetical protein ABRQ39_18875 [Candidatus Eremiobacterota bacterium]